MRLSSLTRSVGARVVLCDGALVAYLRRGNPNVQVWLPEEEPGRGRVARALAEFLVARVREDSRGRCGWTGGNADCDGERSGGGGERDGAGAAGGGVCGWCEGIQRAAGCGASVGLHRA